MRPFDIEGFDGIVTSTAAPTASGWSDLSCRVGFAPTEKPTPFHGALEKPAYTG